MIKPVFRSQLNFTAQALQNKKSPDGKTEPNNRTSIFYINDFHGKSINMERAVTASNAFDSFVPSVPTDKLKLSSGDIQLGEPLLANKAMVEAQDVMGIMASAVGNHECDMPDHIAELVPHMGYKLLACNVNIKPENPLHDKIQKSYIQGDYNGYLLLRRSKREIQLAHRCAEILTGFRQGGIRLPEIGRRKDKAIHEIQ